MAVRRSFHRCSWGGQSAVDLRDLYDLWKQNLNLIMSIRKIVSHAYWPPRMSRMWSTGTKTQTSGTRGLALGGLLGTLIWRWVVAWRPLGALSNPRTCAGYEGVPGGRGYGPMWGCGKDGATLGSSRSCNLALAAALDLLEQKFLMHTNKIHRKIKASTVRARLSENGRLFKKKATHTRRWRDRLWLPREAWPFTVSLRWEIAQ